MTSIVSIQHSLNGGELSPDMWGRLDLEKWRSGTSTCRNFFVNYRGGVTSRAGFAYVGTCKQEYPDDPPRDIPFIFNQDQSFVLEFGTEYMRVKARGAYISETDGTTTHNITNITNAKPVTVTTQGNHGYSVGDWVYIYDAQGLTKLDGLTWKVRSTPTPTTFTLFDLYGKEVDTSTEPVYTIRGKTERIFTLVTPYQGEDVKYLKYAQSADVMTLTCINPETETEYPPYVLTRLANDNWTLSPETFGATITPPTNVTVAAVSSAQPSTWYAYVVTSVSRTTGEESIASSVASVQNNDIALYQGSNNISWDAVEGASSYNIYLAPPAYGFSQPTSSVFGYIGTALGTSYTDNNSTPDYTVSPPSHNNPFAIGTITFVDVTAGGDGNYSNQTIGYSVTTGTGTGFSGYPVVVNGDLGGFVITNPGENYQNGDTITITDSGGGIAKGNFLAAVNPANSTYLVVNGFQVTFADQASYKKPNVEVLLGNTLIDTLQNLATFLNNNNTTASLATAFYSFDATHLYITFKTPGTTGNSFTINAGTSGFTASGATLTGGGVAGTGATANLIVGDQSGVYPSVTSYFQQRKIYANSLNKPDTYWMSQPGLFNNFDSSIPISDADSIEGTPWAEQVNGIQFMVPMPGGLVVFTGKNAWQVNGSNNTPITPSNQTAVSQAFNGCHNHIQPLTVNYDILYIQSKGSIARDLSYNFFTNIYTGTDLTIFSNHLFNGFNLEQWCWCEEPFKLVWGVRNDGTLLSLTYLKEQEVLAWTRHDTQGMFLSVCSIPEPPVDALYVIVQRYINGDWRYYSERLNNRLWNTIEDSFCVDSGLSYPIPDTVPGLAYTLTTPAAFTGTGFPAPFPNGTLTADNYTGTGVTITCVDDTPFTANTTVGNILRMGGGILQITDFNSSSSIVADVIQDISDVIIDGSDRTVKPVPTGQWSLSKLVNTVPNFNHLEGMTVSVLSDGNVVEDAVVTDGNVAVDNRTKGSLITIGLPYTCQVQTLYLDHDDNGSTTQTRRKLINSLGIRVEKTRGLKVGTNQPDMSTQPNFAFVPWDDLTEIKERSGTTFAGQPIQLFTGDYFKNVGSSWSERGQVAFEQSYPLPATILSVISYWNTGDDRN